jgi:hypothetical protein
MKHKNRKLLIILASVLLLVIGFNFGRAFVSYGFEAAGGNSEY